MLGSIRTKGCFLVHGPGLPSTLFQCFVLTKWEDPFPFPLDLPFLRKVWGQFGAAVYLLTAFWGSGIFRVEGGWGTPSPPIFPEPVLTQLSVLGPELLQQTQVLWFLLLVAELFLPGLDFLKCSFIPLNRTGYLVAFYKLTYTPRLHTHK